MSPNSRWADDTRDDLERSLAAEEHDPATVALIRRYIDGEGPDAERKRQVPEMVGRRPKPGRGIPTTTRQGKPLPDDERYQVGKAATNQSTARSAVRAATRNLERLRRAGMEDTGEWSAALTRLAHAKAHLAKTPTVD